jgi:hypothetical protein
VIVSVRLHASKGKCDLENTSAKGIHPDAEWPRRAVVLIVSTSYKCANREDTPRERVCEGSATRLPPIDLPAKRARAALGTDLRPRGNQELACGWWACRNSMREACKLPRHDAAYRELHDAA